MENFAWCTGESERSTLNGPEGSGTPVPIFACALSTPLPDISLSWGWSLLSSVRIVGGDGDFDRPIIGLLATVSRTVAGSSAGSGDLRLGTVDDSITGVDVGVTVVEVRVRVGKKGLPRVLNGRTVTLDGTDIGVRGSSAN